MIERTVLVSHVAAWWHSKGHLWQRVDDYILALILIILGVVGQCHHLAVVWCHHVQIWVLPVWSHTDVVHVPSV